VANINSLFSEDEKEITISRVTGIGSSGEFKVSVNGVIRRVSSAVSETIKIGDTVVLNKSPHGKYYITGITTGLGNSNNVLEVFKNG